MLFKKYKYITHELEKKIERKINKTRQSHVKRCLQSSIIVFIDVNSPTVLTSLNGTAFINSLCCTYKVLPLHFNQFCPNLLCTVKRSHMKQNYAISHEVPYFFLTVSVMVDLILGSRFYLFFI